MPAVPDELHTRLAKIGAVLDILETDLVPDPIMLAVIRAEVEDIQDRMLNASEI